MVARKSIQDAGKEWNQITMESNNTNTYQRKEVLRSERNTPRLGGRSIFTRRAYSLFKILQVRGCGQQVQQQRGKEEKKEETLKWAICFIVTKGKELQKKSSTENKVLRGGWNIQRLGETKKKYRAADARSWQHRKESNKRSTKTKRERRATNALLKRKMYKSSTNWQGTFTQYER